MENAWKLPVSHNERLIITILLDFLIRQFVLAYRFPLCFLFGYITLLSLFRHCAVPFCRKMNETSSEWVPYVMPIRPLDIIILFCIWTGSLLGIILNLLVMILTVASKEMYGGTFIYYIFNLASLDFLSAITWVITGYYLTFYWYQSKSNPTLCYFQMLGQDFSITVSETCNYHKC